MPRTEIKRHADRIEIVLELRQHDARTCEQRRLCLDEGRIEVQVGGEIDEDAVRAGWIDRDAGGRGRYRIEHEPAGFQSLDRREITCRLAEQIVADRADKRDRSTLAPTCHGLVESLAAGAHRKSRCAERFAGLGKSFGQPDVIMDIAADHDHVGVAVRCLR